MIFEEFDRLAPDLTLSEIIAARRRGRLKINQEPRKPGGFKNSEVIAAKLRKLREVLTGKTIPKPPVTHMNRSVLLRRITEFDARLDAIIHGSDAGEAVKESDAGRAVRKVTEFGLLPALAGGVLGSGLGSKLSGKKYNAATGKWEDEHGNETSAPGVSSAVGGVAGAGAGYGASKLHSSVMSGYGGEGGAGQAYRNVARNVTAQAGQKVTSAIAPGFAEGSELLKKIKASRLLKKFYEANAPRLIEMEARLELKKKAVTEFAGGYVKTNRGVEKESGVKAHLKRNAGTYIGSTAGLPTFPLGTGAGVYIDYLRKKKNIEATGKERAVAMSGRRNLIEFAEPYDEKKRSVLKPYLAGLLTVPAIGAAAAAAGPGRHLLAGAADAIRARRYGFAKGSNIPASKVAEYLRMLHLGRIKA